MSSVTINYHLGKDVLEVTGEAQDVITVAKALMYTNGDKRATTLTVQGKMPQITGDYQGLAKRDVKKVKRASPANTGKIAKGKLVPTGTYSGMVRDAHARLSKFQEVTFPNVHKVPFDKFASGVRAAVVETFGVGTYVSRKTENGTLAIKLK